MQPACTIARRNTRTPWLAASRGHTLIELVTVIVILGILAGIAVPRFFDRQTFEEAGFYEEVASALRYGQKIAVGSGCPVQVTITAGGYDLKQQAGSGNRCIPDDSDWTGPIAVLMPDGQAAAGSTPAGITLGPVTTFQFDGLGQTDLGGNLNVTVGALTMTVQAQSGYVLTP